MSGGEASHMKLFVQAPIGPQTGLAEIDVIPDHTVAEIKQQVCNRSVSIHQLSLSCMEARYWKRIPLLPD